MLWNVVTFSDTGKRYPDVALTRIWRRIPPALYARRAVRSFGSLLHRRACATQERRPVDATCHTFFLRNIPQFDVLRDIAAQWPLNSVRYLVAIGCSSGAELYSALWVLRTSRPDVRVEAVGIDIDRSALQRADAGVFAVGDHELSRLAEADFQQACAADPPLLHRQGDRLTVPGALHEHVRWMLADARDPSLAASLGPQDVVFANNILCHMYDREAEACLQNIASLLAPSGHLFMYGVDLDVKARTVRRLGLEAIPDRVQDVYMADWNALKQWPLRYWGREPMDRRRPDWLLRYGSVFRRPGGVPGDGRPAPTHLSARRSRGVVNPLS